MQKYFQGYRDPRNLAHNHNCRTIFQKNMSIVIDFFFQSKSRDWFKKMCIQVIWNISMEENQKLINIWQGGGNFHSASASAPFEKM